MDVIGTEVAVDITVDNDQIYPKEIYHEFCDLNELAVLEDFMKAFEKQGKQVIIEQLQILLDSV